MIFSVSTVTSNRANRRPRRPGFHWSGWVAMC